MGIPLQKTAHQIIDQRGSQNDWNGSQPRTGIEEQTEDKEHHISNILPFLRDYKINQQ